MLINTQNMAATKHRKASVLLWIPLLASLLIPGKAEIFSTEPKSQLIPQGSLVDVILACRAGDELTNPTYTWMKDNTTLVIEGRYNLYTGELHISAPEDSDAGNYICVIDSDEGRVASNTAELTFSYLKQSTSVVSHQITQAQSTGVTMPCGEMDYSPEFSIYFMWDNINTWARIPWQGTKTHFISQKTGNMYLANPQPSDSGSYKCTGTSIQSVNNIQAKADGNTVPLAIEPATANYAPAFMVSPDEVTYAKLNGKTFIECFASGNPTPTITWTKDGEPLPKFAQLSPSGQLYFVDLTEAAEGTYTCTASNEQGSVSASGKLVLRYPPIWLEEISSNSYDLASVVSWNCAAKAVPAATYAWWKNGQPINQSDSSVSITDPTEENSRMTINDLKRENAGIYQCVATNDLGNIVSSANLVVNSYPPVIEPEVLSVTYAALGEEATIFCPHTAAPAADVTWMKDGKTIQGGQKHSILSDASLIIRDVTADDEGEYTCSLINILGTDDSTGHLRAYQQTVITEAPEDVSPMAGESASLTCAASKDDALSLTWKWHHDDELLENLFYDHYSFNGGTLNINSATNEQSGEYKCCAITSVFTPCATANVYVTDRPDAPEGVSVGSTTHNSQELSWTEPFDNYSPITGYSIEYMNSFNTDWQKAETDPALVESTTCTVLNLLPFNDYTYRVYATNNYGTSDASKDSPVESTTKGAPPKAPSSVGGGGGEEGQLVVTWEPLTVEFYGSVSVDYVVAVQKRTAGQVNNVIDLPSILEPNNNTTLEEEEEEDNQEAEWITQTVMDPKKGEYTFEVDASEVYAPYNVRVRAVNDKGEGPWSLTRIVHTFENAPDTAPAGVGVGRTPPEAYLVHLKWDVLAATTGRIVGYVVEVIQKAGPNIETKIERTTDAGPLITVKGLSANIVYQARVAGFNGAGQGPWSKPFTFNTAKKPPSQPPKDVRVSIKNTVVTADWKPIVYGAGQGMDEAPLKGYKIQYHAVNSSRPMVVHTTTNNHYTFTVRNNSRFNLQVRGYSEGGDGVASRIFYLSTESTAAPGSIHCCGANAVKFNSAIIMIVTLLWMLFVKLDL